MIVFYRVLTAQKCYVLQNWRAEKKGLAQQTVILSKLGRKSTKRVLLVKSNNSTFLVQPKRSFLWCEFQEYILSYRNIQLKL